MRKIIRKILITLSILILISDVEKITLLNIVLKVISLIYLWLLAKANNYCDQGRR